MLTYPVRLERDENGTVLVSFPDVPGAITFGGDEQEALARAVDALETMFMGIIADREPIPAPSRARRGQKPVRVPPLTEAKLHLYQTMRAARSVSVSTLSCTPPRRAKPRASR